MKRASSKESKLIISELRAKKLRNANLASNIENNSVAERNVPSETFLERNVFINCNEVLALENLFDLPMFSSLLNIKYTKNLIIIEETLTHSIEQIDSKRQASFALTKSYSYHLYTAIKMNKFNDLFENNGEGPNERARYTLLGSAIPPSTDILQNILSHMSEMNSKMDKILTANEELKQRVADLEAENIAMHTRLLTEVTSQRKNLQQVKMESVLPKEPFGNIFNLEEFEQKLQSSPDMCTKLEHEIYKYCISNPTKFVRHVWKKMFTDELAWKGTKEKKCLQAMTITAIIRGAFNRKFNVDEKVFNNCSLRWFQTANDRIKYRENLKNKQ